MVVPSWPPLNPDRGASQSPRSHTAPGLPVRSAVWKPFGNREPGAQTDTDCSLRNVAVFSPLIHTGLYFAAGDLASSISCIAAAICRYPSSSLGNSLPPGMEMGMRLAERLFLPFHLAHYFSASHLFIPSPFLVSLLSPYACTANVYILPHFHRCPSDGARESQSKLSAATKHQKET